MNPSFRLYSRSNCLTNRLFSRLIIKKCAHLGGSEHIFLDTLLRLKRLNLGEDFFSSVSQADNFKRLYIMAVGAAIWEDFDAMGYLTVTNITYIGPFVSKYAVKILEF